MDDSFFIRGMVLGFSIAAPVGPIGVLCIRRTLAGGIASGLISGLGTAAADAAYGLIAAYSLTSLSALFLNHTLILRLCGGLFLLYMGHGVFRSLPADHKQSNRFIGRTGDFASAFFLTLTNPLTILSFVAVFAGLGLGETPGNYWLAVTTVVGVFTGSLLWWLILSGTVAFFRHRFDPQKLLFVNKLSGIIIAFFGTVSLISIWR